jgi:hypothetical protein
MLLPLLIRVLCVRQPESDDLVMEPFMPEKRLDATRQHRRYTTILCDKLGNDRQRAQAYCQAKLAKGQAMRRRPVEVTARKKHRKTVTAAIQYLLQKTKVAAPSAPQLAQPASIEEQPAEPERILSRPARVTQRG